MPCPHHDIKIVRRSNRQSAVALLPAHVKVALVGVVIEISHGLAGVPVELDVKRNVLVQRVGLLGIVAHGVLGAHPHELLGFVQAAGLFAEAVEAIPGRDLAGVDAAVVAVLQVGQVHNVGVELGALGIIDTDAEGVLLDLHPQLGALEHRLVGAVLQRAGGGLDALADVLHKAIQTVFPGGGYQRVGFLRKVTVKAGADAYDVVGQQQDPQLHPVRQDTDDGAFPANLVHMRTNFHGHTSFPKHDSLLSAGPGWSGRFFMLSL